MCELKFTLSLLLTDERVCGQHRVQQKRHEALERARQEERLLKMKEDRNIRRQIVAATRESYGIK